MYKAKLPYDYFRQDILCNGLIQMMFRHETVLYMYNTQVDVEDWLKDVATVVSTRGSEPFGLTQGVLTA